MSKATAQSRKKPLDVLIMFNQLYIFRVRTKMCENELFTVYVYMYIYIYI